MIILIALYAHLNGLNAHATKPFNPFEAPSFLDAASFLEEKKEVQPAIDTITIFQDGQITSCETSQDGSELILDCL